MRFHDRHTIGNGRPRFSYSKKVLPVFIHGQKKQFTLIRVHAPPHNVYVISLLRSYGLRAIRKPGELALEIMRNNNNNNNNNTTIIFEFTFKTKQKRLFTPSQHVVI